MEILVNILEKSVEISMMVKQNQSLWLICSEFFGDIDNLSHWGNIFNLFCSKSSLISKMPMYFHLFINKPFPLFFVNPNHYPFGLTAWINELGIFEINDHLEQKRLKMFCQWDKMSMSPKNSEQITHYDWFCLTINEISTDFSRMLIRIAITW